MGRVTVEVPMAQQHYELLTSIAAQRDQSAGELLEHLTTEFLETARAEEANHRAVEEAQTRYPGEYVAIRQGQILAHANHATTLLQIIGEQFGLTGADVLLAKIDFPDLRVRHPRLTP